MSANSPAADRRAGLDAGMTTTLSGPDPVVPEPEIAVDLSVLARLVTEMGDPSSQTQIEVIDLYLGQSDGEIHELNNAAHAGDLAQVRRTAHTLGSGSALIGACKLADLLTDIGRLAHGGRTDLAPAGTAIRAEYDRVATELRAYRATLLHAPTAGGTDENPCR